MSDPSRRCRLALSMPLLTTICLASSVTQAGGRHCWCPNQPLACTDCTVFRAGPPGENLQIFVVGPTFNDLDIYFKANEQQQNVLLERKLDGASDLHLNGSLSLAPLNPAGTFAVRYGPDQSTFKLFAWKSQSTKITATVSVQLEPKHPVCFTWITSRMLSVAYGANFAKREIYRLDSQDRWVDVNTNKVVEDE
jgi:hypothetical protein